MHFAGSIDSKCLLGLLNESLNQIIIEGQDATTKANFTANRIDNISKIITNGKRFIITMYYATQCLVKYFMSLSK